MNYDDFVTKFTASGSLVSFAATSAILLYCMFARGSCGSLRHVLLLNLFLAELLTSLNSSVSGFLRMDMHQIYPGTACVANGFLAQVTAQAVDFTIFAIVLGTLLAVTQLISLPKLATSRAKKLICLSIWAIPLITSVTAAAIQDAIKPDVYNWCDLAARPDIRYALVDGWRLAIMMLTTCMYVFICLFCYYHRTLFTLSNRLKPLYGRLKTPSPVNQARPEMTAPCSMQARPLAPLGIDTGREQCSDISLPLQGYDCSGVDCQEKEKAIDNRTEKIGRWIYARHPGLINSHKSQETSPLDRAAHFSAGAQPTRSCSITAKLSRPRLALGAMPQRLSATNKRLLISQFPKVPQHVKSSGDLKASGMSSRGVVDSEGFASRHHRQSAKSKSFKSGEAHTASSLDTVPRMFLFSKQSPKTRVNWPFLEQATSLTGSSSTSSLDDDKPLHQLSPPRLNRTQSAEPPDATTERQPGPSIIKATRGFHQGAAMLAGTLEQNTRTNAKRPAGIHVDTPQELKPDSKSHSTGLKSSNPRAITPPEPVVAHGPPAPVSQIQTFCTAGNAPFSPQAQPWEFPESPRPETQTSKTFLLSKSSYADSLRHAWSPHASETAVNEVEIRRMLLLYAYPLAYVVLWLPWMVNSFMAASGSVPRDKRAMYALVGLSQYLGLANAVTYAVYEWLRCRRRGKMASKAGRVAGEKNTGRYLGA